MRKFLPILICLLMALPSWAIERNASSQYIEFYVVDTVTGTPKTGDAANLTAYVSIDGDTTPDTLTDTSATEVDATKAPGLYRFDLSSGETNGKSCVYTAKSITSGIYVYPRFVYTDPPNFSLTSINASGLVTLADSSITTTKFVAGAIDSAAIGTGAIDADAIATDAIGALEIADNAIDAGSIATDAITDTKIAANAIGSLEIAASAIGSSELATGCITSSQFANDAITINKIQDGSISSSKFAAGAIDAAAIATDAIGSAELSAAAVTKIANGVPVLYTGTISSIDSQTVYTIPAVGTGTATLAAGQVIAIYDTSASSTMPSIRAVTSFDSATAKVTVSSAPDFTVAAGDVVRIYPQHTGIASMAAKLPSKSYLAGSNNSDGDVQLNEATGTLPADAINATTIADNSIDANTFAAFAITAGAINSGAITSTKFASNAITSSVIATDAIGAGQVSAAATRKIQGVLGNGTIAATPTSATVTLNETYDGSLLIGQLLVMIDSGGAKYNTRVITGGSVSSLSITPALDGWENAGDTYVICPASNYIADIKAKLPSKSYLTGTANSDGDVQLNEATGALPADSITASSIATDAIGAAEVADNAIDAGAIATDAITATEIATDAIGASEIADNAIDAGSIATDAITNTKIATDAIGAAEIAASAIGASEIANDALGNNEIADGAISASKFAAGAIDASAIATDAIGASEIADNAIDAGSIAADAIGASEIATDAIGAAEVAADAIGASEVATNAIGASEIATGAITSTKFAAGAIDSTAIAANAIGSSQIAASAIGSSQLATGAFTNDEVSTTFLQSFITVNSGVTSGSAVEGSVAKEVADLMTAAFNDSTISIDASLLDQIADAVWNEPTVGHTTAATFGEQAVTKIDSILDDTGTSGVTIADSSITSTKFAAGAIDANAIADSAIDAGAIAADAIGASEIAADAITSSELAASAASEVSAATWDQTTAGHVTAGTFGEQVKTDGDTTETRVSTLYTDWINGGRLDNLLDAVATQSSVTAIGSNVTSIKTHTDKMETAIEADGPVYRFTSNALELGAAGGLTTGAIADAVWDEVRAGHTTAGTFGYYLDGSVVSAGSGSPSVIADAVWDELRAGHVTAGSFGEGVNIKDGGIAASTIASNAITSTKIATDAIGAAQIADNAIDAGAVATDTITAAKIASNAITSTKIAADAIGATQIADNTIDAGAIAADAIGASEVADNAIDAGAIAANAITNAKIATDAIGAAQIAAAALGTSELAPTVLGASYNSSTDSLEAIRDRIDVSAPVGTAGGGVLTASLADSSLSPRKRFELIKGEQKTLTFVAMASGRFSSATPTTITVKIKDAAGTTITKNNVDVTRITEEADLQVVRVTLTPSETSSLRSGYVTVELSFDNDKAVLTTSLFIISGI